MNKDESCRHPLATVVSPANLVSLSRLLLSPLLFWTVLEADGNSGTSWLAVFLGFVLAASDILDGHLARIRGTVSKWGAFIDPLADKVVVIGTALCLVEVERFHLLPVVLLTLREIFITLYRLLVARKGLSIPARKSAKWKTTIQGIALMIAVMPWLENSQLFVDFGLWVAVAFTVVTGIQYLMDGILATSTTGE
ncbi:MAG: Putative CDP-diacylglycerol--glycerol-3-phosphate 3-phosphatidyl-transferase 2 [Acidimicrobiaceae bacterium]|nr:MAG: Putative CDP-diacylglycerol--glycerol-3-phosphate 3-phosphatidyl-transferase 2 [Acidimicrobiaceae bacterium]